MKKQVLIVTISLLALSLAGCSGTPDRANEAREMCLDAAQDQVGSELDASDVETVNMGDALFESEITDERETDDENALFTVSGDVKWTDAGTETRKSLTCMVEFTDGTPQLSLGPTLS